LGVLVAEEKSQNEVEPEGVSAKEETLPSEETPEDSIALEADQLVEAPDAMAEAAPSPEGEAKEPLAVEEEPPGPVLSSGPGKQWYVVHTYSGYEAKVKASIEERVNALGLQDKITQILVPSEQVVEMKKGKKRIHAKKFFPGYILVEMELSDETWYLIKNTPKVTGFLGGARNPTPLPTEEISHIIEQIRGEAAKPKPRVLFEPGEHVKIIDGPFSGFSGVIDEVDEVRGKLRVMVSIFGRATPVEMEFLQVEKL
jgi:transcriptional antiterminator NusG